MHDYLTDERLRKEERLLKRAEFDVVFENGRSAGNKLLVVHWMKNEHGHPRLGLVVGTRFGNAVKRNQWKRRIRDIYRRNKQAFGSRDIVVLPAKRPEAKTADHAQLKAALLSLLKRTQ
jgi:ribonuclease P protein component